MDPTLKPPSLARFHRTDHVMSFERNVIPARCCGVFRPSPFISDLIWPSKPELNMDCLPFRCFKSSHCNWLLYQKRDKEHDIEDKDARKTVHVRCREMTVDFSGLRDHSNKSQNA